MKAKGNYIKLDRGVEIRMHCIIIILLSSINLGCEKVMDILLRLWHYPLVYPTNTSFDQVPIGNATYKHLNNEAQEIYLM